MSAKASIDQFEIECAVWHPNAHASTISQIVGLTPRIQWSSGDINGSTGALRDCTYCRFTVGRYSQIIINNGLKMLEPFKTLYQNDVFYNPGATIIVYFKNLDNASELHINLLGLSTINEIKASIVFR